MKNSNAPKGICRLSKKEFPLSQLVPANAIRTSIFDLIKKHHPDFDATGFVSFEELNKYRDEYMRNLMKDEHGELTSLDKEVMESIRKSELVSRNVNEEMDTHLTYGERIADKVAEFGGSWRFIISFLTFMLIWILINIYVLVVKPFDPYPFILLNLILSCVASLQAPVIMMSQNRQEAKDRIRSEHDYQVNLKAKLEIRQLHEKMDHLLIQQGQRMKEIQQIQIELMEQILKQVKR